MANTSELLALPSALLATVLAPLRAELVRLQNLTQAAARNVSSVLGQCEAAEDVAWCGGDVAVCCCNRTASHEYSCPWCSFFLQPQLAAVQEQIRNQTAAPLDSLQSAVLSLNDTFIRRRSQIVSEIFSLRDTLLSVHNDYNSARDIANDVFDEIRFRDGQRHLGTWILFVVPLMATALVVTAAMLRSSLLFRLNVWATFLVMTIMWLLFAVHLPITMIISDACVALDKEEVLLLSTRPTAHLALRGQASLLDDRDAAYAKALRACYNNDSLVEAFNATDVLNYPDRIRPHTSVEEVSGKFSFDKVDATPELTRL